MKTKSVIRKIFGVVFLVCLFQVSGIAQENVGHKGIPMRDAIAKDVKDPLANMSLASSMRIPLHVDVEVEDWTGAPVKGVSVVVKAVEYHYSNIWTPYRKTILVNGKTQYDGGISANRTVFVNSLNILRLEISIDYTRFGQTYFAEDYRVDCAGPTKIQIIFQRNNQGIRGWITNAKGQKTELEFK